MEQSASSVTTEARGVYWATFTKNGLPVMYAVDRRGDIVRSIVVRPEWNVERVANWLSWKLEQLDPAPHLALVRDTPAKPKIDHRVPLDTLTEERMHRDPRFRARVNRYLSQLAATPRARI